MGIFDWLFGKKETPSEPKKDCCSKKEIEKKDSNKVPLSMKEVIKEKETPEIVEEKETKSETKTNNLVNKKIIKIKLENEIILSVTEENYKKYGYDLDECNEDGIDYELLEFDEDCHLTLLDLKPEGSYVTIHNYDVESETSSGPISGTMLWFNFINCSFPEHIKKKFNIPKYGESIYFIDGKPITNPEIFTSDEEMFEERNYGEYILKFDEVDWEDLSQYL